MNATTKEIVMDDAMKSVHFGRRLMALLDKHQMTQAELARKASVGRDSINKYIHGRSLPSRRVAMRIAEIFKVSLDDLLPSIGAGDAARTVEADFKLIPNQPGRVWLRINKSVPFDVATHVMGVLQGRRDMDLAPAPDGGPSPEEVEARRRRDERERKRLALEAQLAALADDD